MTKLLRSLIHERFPFELRVEMDLLSRRRDISNREKQEELIKLLRKYQINDIVPLGPGTNRYAFKLSGFVIKFATDNDGKIDNLKEFKMAKRLYPYVIRVHEVSNNGTIMVCEYIQPFDSFGEMLQHQERIREILTEMGSVYLIGDVGITEKNFGNWGLRIGTQEPVCLDFAYVYEVSSSLFVCQYCQSNAMLLPNRDFTELKCSNTSCGKMYLFEHIRGKIGNEVHRHEIGDLGAEGYVLSTSNVLTELTVTQSNYLSLRTQETDEAPKPTTFVAKSNKPGFVMDREPMEYIKTGGNNS